MLPEVDEPEVFLFYRRGEIVRLARRGERI